ncbi:MAG TPA: DUF2442 domain-containing protein [Longimicrobium sp.]|nr:DUF2442 domain-containing protein [Longimicrobium sp.]
MPEAKKKGADTHAKRAPARRRVADAAEITAARQRGEEAAAIEPRAIHAEYDAERGLVMVQLANGSWFGFPAADAPGLENATPTQLQTVEILPGAYGLRWDEVDADISLPGLMFKLLNVKAWAARWVGQQKSDAKAAASRANGRRGGRPRTGRPADEPAAVELPVKEQRVRNAPKKQDVAASVERVPGRTKRKRT